MFKIKDKKKYYFHWFNINSVYCLFKKIWKYCLYVFKLIVNGFYVLIKVLRFLIKQIVFPWLAVDNFRKSLWYIRMYGFREFFMKCRKKIISGLTSDWSVNLALSAIFLSILKKIFPPQVALHNLKLSISYIKNHGFKSFLLKCKQKANEEVANKNTVYGLWIEKNEPNDDDLKKQRKTKFRYNPLISIITPVFNTPKQMLIDMIESVINQSYHNWELCIVDGGSKYAYIKEVLNKYSNKDRRIKIKYLEENKGISENSNEAISFATGVFLGFLDHDDTLASFSLFEVVSSINKRPDVDVLYSDEDKIVSGVSKRFDAFFKPDFSFDMLRSANYVCHFLVVRKSIGDKINWFRNGFDGAQDYDLIIRLSEKTGNIVHIPKILYHWRMHLDSTAMRPEAKSYAYAAGVRCLCEHLDRIGLKGKVSNLNNSGYYRIDYTISSLPLVSIVILDRGNVDALRRCVSSIIRITNYRNFEIIIENNSLNKETFDFSKELKQFSNIRIIDCNYQASSSYSKNFAVRHAKGEVILFLDNDIEIIKADWLRFMLEYVLRGDVGAVGAKLYYPNGSIQHSGFIIGLCGIVEHPHIGFDGKDSDYFNRLDIVRNVSAVSGDCLMIRKEVFYEAGGFDESLKVAFDDIDLCLKIRESGYLIVWTPYAEIRHHELKKRRLKDMERKEDALTIKDKWKNVLKEGDPYYNINLALDRAAFNLRI
jgi:glycosyltransferase involved in cell wall biosynthesis